MREHKSTTNRGAMSLVFVGTRSAASTATFWFGRPKIVGRTIHWMPSFLQRQQGVLAIWSSCEFGMSTSLGNWHRIRRARQPRHIKREYLPLGRFEPIVLGVDIVIATHPKAKRGREADVEERLPYRDAWWICKHVVHSQPASLTGLCGRHLTITHSAVLRRVEWLSYAVSWSARSGIIIK